MIHSASQFSPSEQAAPGQAVESIQQTRPETGRWRGPRCRIGELSLEAGLSIITSLGILAAWTSMYDRRLERLVVSDSTKQLFVRSLGSDEPSVRSRALDALRQASDRTTAAAIRPLLDDSEPVVRVEALKALEPISTAGELVELARQALKDPSELVVRHGLGLLARTPGELAFHSLIELRAELAAALVPDWAEAIARRPEPCSAALIVQLLDDPALRVRRAGTAALRAHPAILPIAERIARATAESDSWARASLIESLAADRATAAARQAILAAVDDRSAWVRRAALAAAGAELPEHAIVKLLGDPDSTVRRAAAQAAGNRVEQLVTAALLEQLGDRERLVAEAAGEQLAQRGGDEIEAALLERLATQDPLVVQQAARALGLMHRPSSLDALRRLETHSSEAVRQAAYRAIGSIADPASGPWLLQRAEQEKGYARAVLNDALGQMRYAQAIPHLLQDCHYPDKKSKGLIPSLFTPTGPWPPKYPAADTAVATAAVRALGRIGDAKTLPAIAEVSSDVLRDEAFWSAVAWSLGEFHDPQAAAPLTQLGIVGTISQGESSIIMPDAARIQALRSIATLKLTNLCQQILEIDGTSCSWPVRRAAAESLTSLTGRLHASRPPGRRIQFFIEDNGTPLDHAYFKLPICYEVKPRGL